LGPLPKNIFYIKLSTYTVFFLLVFEASDTIAISILREVTVIFKWGGIVSFEQHFFYMGRGLILKNPNGHPLDRSMSTTMPNSATINL